MKLYYMGYYGDTLNDRKSAPSADTKVDYMLDTLKECFSEIEFLSFCNTNNRNCIFKKYPGYLIKKNGIKIRYFSSYSSRFRLIRIIGRFLTWIEQKRFIKKNCIDSNSNILIYHSLSFFKLYRFLNKYNKKFTLEVEEIYSDVLNKNILRKKEIKFFKIPNKFIFPTNMLNNLVNVNNKPFIIVHGTYKLEKIISKKILDNNYIHCVYAGTLDSRKGGADFAVESARYLSSKYHIHILGFGSDNDVKNIKHKISQINKTSEAKVFYDGVLKGDDYIAFLQNCDIGLSTQNPNEAFNATSFPSKILSYMCNGLNVVTVRIPVVETSLINDYVYYYDSPNPEEIAKTIKNVNIKKKNLNRDIINKLDIDLKKDIHAFFESE